MNPLDLGLFVFILAVAVLSAIVEWRQRSGWAPVYLIVAIVLAFVAHWLISMGALQ